MQASKLIILAHEQEAGNTAFLAKAMLHATLYDRADLFAYKSRQHWPAKNWPRCARSLEVFHCRFEGLGIGKWLRPLLAAHPAHMQPPHSDYFPDGQPDNAVYDLVAALTSIPSISRGWVQEANDGFRELTVRYTRTLHP
jgi:hypothetical protein